MEVTNMNRRKFLTRAGVGSLALASLPALTTTVLADEDRRARVRWDIISVDIPITTLSAGGFAFASADAHLKIKLTGFGTSAVPANDKLSRHVTGGGTWETFTDNVSTGSGTYRVRAVASWQFANFQAQVFTDNIGNTKERANGNAILLIRYSDGSRGTLGIGCHGPGAPAGIQEGVIATKGFMTYWTAEPPPPDGDANRTLFHLRGGHEDDSDG